MGTVLVWASYTHYSNKESGVTCAAHWIPHSADGGVLLLGLLATSSFSLFISEGSGRVTHEFANQFLCHDTVRINYPHSYWFAFGVGMGMKQNQSRCCQALFIVSKNLYLRSGTSTASRADSASPGQHANKIDTSESVHNNRVKRTPLHDLRRSNCRKGTAFMLVLYGVEANRLSTETIFPQENPIGH